MDFFYDLGSPYAWLTAERVSPAARWVPVLLGGIFVVTGRSSWAETDARREGMEEVERRARERGLPVPTWPDPWPNNGLTAMRAAVAAHDQGEGERFALEAFRVHFVDGLALSDTGNIALAAERAGLDPAELLAATQDQTVKDRLRLNTEEAIEAGVFGVPSARLLSGEIVWGDDRIPA